jgi:hypothetical protein
VVLLSPDGEQLQYIVHLDFPTINNMVGSTVVGQGQLLVNHQASQRRVQLQ